MSSNVGPSTPLWPRLEARVLIGRERSHDPKSWRLIGRWKRGGAMHGGST